MMISVSRTEFHLLLPLISPPAHTKFSFRQLCTFTCFYEEEFRNLYRLVVPKEL
jgi:hypothetical protein